MFYRTIDTDLISAYLYFEELSCLSAIVGQPCSILDEHGYQTVFDLSGFELVESVPEGHIECNLSGYVCMYDEDIKGEGSNFLSYRRKQTGALFRLDKFLHQDLEVVFDTPNYYESKYYAESDLRTKAFAKAVSFGLNPIYVEKFEHLRRVFAKLPLVVLEHTSMHSVSKKRHAFDFHECFYVSDCDKHDTDKFFRQNGIKGHDLIQMARDFNISYREANLELLPVILEDNFTDVYTAPYCNLGAVVSKGKFSNDPTWTPKILGVHPYGIVQDFQFKVVEPEAPFDFARYNFNLGRTEVLNVLRFRDCVHHILQNG